MDFIILLFKNSIKILKAKKSNKMDIIKQYNIDQTCKSLGKISINVLY